jgi:hypothetical protein
MAASYTNLFGINQATQSILRSFIQPIFTAAAIVFSALWASGFVSRSINSARSTAKLQETLKLITRIELDLEFIKAKNVWSEYRSRDKHDDEFSELMAIFILAGSTMNAGKSTKKGNQQVEDDLLKIEYESALRLRIEDAQLLVTFFNQWELTAIAIKKGIIDQDFYQDWYASNYVRIWNYSVGAVGALRVLLANERLYENWERLAREWATERNMKIREALDYSIADLAYIAFDEPSRFRMKSDPQRES